MLCCTSFSPSKLDHVGQRARSRRQAALWSHITIIVPTKHVSYIVVVEEVEVEMVEEKEPFTIETGDSVKVKQVLDDATIKAITEGGYEANYSWDNMKLLLMALSCVFAMVAQFFPIPFPASRPLLAVCCAAYFIISSILQYIITFVDKDTILFVKPSKVSLLDQSSHQLQFAETFVISHRNVLMTWRSEQVSLGFRSTLP